MPTEDDTFERLRKVPFDLIKIEMLGMDDRGISLNDRDFSKFLSVRGWEMEEFMNTLKTYGH